MLKIFFFILSIFFITPMGLPSAFAGENTKKMSCCELQKQHKKCCKKENAQHHLPKKKQNSKGCEKNNSHCICIPTIAPMAMKNQYAESTQNNIILLSQKYLLLNDKKPTLVYLDLWLLPKI